MNRCQNAQRSAWVWIMAGVVLVFVLAACARESDAPDPTDSLVPQTGNEAQPGSSSPTFPPAPSSADGTEEMVQELAAEFLAGELGIAVNSLNIITVTAMTWSDSSLGCPQPGMMYAQVITPGFLMLLRDSGGTEYKVHAKEDGSSTIVCDE